MTIGFFRFSADHAFEKPNDERALNLMNSCAVSMLEHFPDIVFAYGVSDEYRYDLSLHLSLNSCHVCNFLNTVINVTREDAA